MDAVSSAGQQAAGARDGAAYPLRLPRITRSGEVYGRCKSAFWFGDTMRLVDGKYQCAWCGVQIDAPLDARPEAKIIGVSGKPTVRALTLDGEEIHRCAKPTD